MAFFILRDKILGRKLGYAIGVAPIPPPILDRRWGPTHPTCLLVRVSVKIISNFVDGFCTSFFSTPTSYAPIPQYLVMLSPLAKPHKLISPNLPCNIQKSRGFLTGQYLPFCAQFHSESFVLCSTVHSVHYCVGCVRSGIDCPINLSSFCFQQL